MQKVDQIVTALNLLPHPEGGFYKEVYRSNGSIPKQVLPNYFNGDRNYATSIYFLLSGQNFSAFHKINQDETWHFYQGDAIKIHMIHPDRKYTTQLLGLDLAAGIEPQFTVPAHVWFAAQVMQPNGYSLLGCQVSPGFDFADFNLAKRDELSAEFPQHTHIIKTYTRA